MVQNSTTQPLYEVMRQNLIKLIETEHINYLPNEKELMTRYNVSRNTLRRAILELTKEGILQPMQGIGTLVHPVSGLKAESRILLVYDIFMPVYQQEIFQKLLFMLGQSQLRTNVLILDKENVDIDIFNMHLRECDAVIIDMDCSYSPVIRGLVAQCGKKRICLRWNATPLNLSSVEIDLVKGSYGLTKHLLELGHRKFIDLGSMAYAPRRQGLEQALKEFGLTRSAVRDFNIPWFKGQKEREQAMQYANMAFDNLNNATAIIANNDCIALCVEEVALQRGIRIPEDISLVGFDNLEESAYYPVPLTTCSGNKNGIIREAIAYLFSSRKPNELYYKTIEPELIFRKSTGPVKINKKGK